MRGQSQFIDVHASADFLAPGAIETNRYQTEILDRLRRRFAFGQRINLTPATGQPSRYFEQVALPTAGFVDPRRITPTASQSTRIEQTAPLKAIVAQINYGLFDIEVNQQQNQFGYLEAKDLSDTVDAVLRSHDIALWSGTDSSLTLPQTYQYYGVSGQIFDATPIAGCPSNKIVIASGANIVDGLKHEISVMAANQLYEVHPSAFYANPLFLDQIDQQEKIFQRYFGKAQILPGVIVQAVPTQMGLLPFVPDPAITNYGAQANVGGVGTTYTGFVISEDLVEYHWLTNPLPRVFQLGLTGNLASQYTVLKFGCVVAKGAYYAHAAVTATI